jgi:hypothetical protein
MALSHVKAGMDPFTLKWIWGHKAQDPAGQPSIRERHLPLTNRSRKATLRE